MGGSLTQSQEMICGGRYLSGDQAMRVFAADPDSGKPMRLEVKWRSGKRSVVSGVKANRIYEVDEAGAEESSKLKAQSSREDPRAKTQDPRADSQAPTSSNQARTLNLEHRTSNIEHRTTNNPQPASANDQPAPLISQPFFEDVSSLLGHVHPEAPFDDWARQPLLPRRLSRLGPGLSWYDVDGDGWEDLIVSAGRGGQLALFINEHGQRFRKIAGEPRAAADQGAVLGWPDGEGNRKLLVAVDICSRQRTQARQSRRPVLRRDQVGR